ncbi:hypothetical protein BIU82_02020 [Arthrobacter sp. SW1]|uniref:DUF4350 domain-containing protein n=1 Tax=Arthrobacter sp. SW1 TaxID=1920889 RepID=UPI000877D5CE|nr:DUF4350 domain-containing protein [Arthrobacter sp. SW1]OFI39846.1 hypothetical protein BIU82_02020 [Arthrobacter sp. SW1]
MTALEQQAAHTDAGDAAPRQSFLRRHLVWIVIGSIVALTLAYVIISRLASDPDERVLSPGNPAPAGAMAVAEILRTQGVDVSEPGSFEEALAMLDAKDGTATLLLYDRNGYLGDEQLRRLRGAAGRTVVVSPARRTLRALDSGGLRNAGVVPEGKGVLEPGCEVDDPRIAGNVSVKKGQLYTGDGNICYRVETGGGLYAAAGNGRVVVLGSPDLLSNDLLDDRGNAALALRTLGTSPDLVWYLPGLGDVPPDRNPATLDELAPPWVAFLGPWLLLIAVLAVLWRGRRLGPLVFEPLPVVVKAAETAEGRARLYQDSRALDRAAANLHAGTAVRLARVFRLGPEAGIGALVDAVSRKTGRPPVEVRNIFDHRPDSQSGLVQWAQTLEQLEQEASAR